MKGAVAGMNVLDQALHYINEDKIEQAVELLDEHVAKAAPEDAFEMAELYRQLGYYEKAVPVLEELIASFPEESELSAMLADIYIELGEDEKALQLIGEGTIDPEDPQYLEIALQQADLYQAQGLFEVAEQKLLQAKQHAPNEIVIDFALGELLFSIGDYGRAAHFYEQVQEEMKEIAGVSVSERLAECMALLGKEERALDLYKENASEEPEHLFKYGFTAFQADRMDIAIKAWEELIEKDPDYLSVYSWLARAYENENLLEEALETANKGLAKDSFNKELYFEAGTFACQLGSFKKGEGLIREAVALDPDYKEAVVYLARMLEEQERHEETIELIDSISDIGAEDALYNWIAAKAYAEMENYKQALKQYREAYISLQEDSDFLKEFGYFLVEEGLMADAAEVLGKYMALEPLDADTAGYLARINGTGDGQFLS
ncbi:tetratricopeptide repeat protein [Aciduricibacillus chroicocephali]|uniref:Tetratricopeptide repeat protein n=1 Tax=Aciduricibacillus chroicocephali TaxID=3054939 RepID=A0ABY9KSC2_9BACI|nr:tetratricopeptide repeat protein [Bacillaceae bacterium 44XB]